MAPLSQEEVEKIIKASKPFLKLEIGDINFSERTFDVPISFDYAEFVGNVNFCNSVFNKRITFVGAKFGKQACFNGAHFTKGVDFLNAEFKLNVEAKFWQTHFEDRTNFNNAIFWHKAQFNSALFLGRTAFAGTKFKCADFEYAQFEEVFFNFSRFYETAEFGNIEFKDKASFLEVEFCKGARFENARFWKTAAFQGNKVKVIFQQPSTFKNAQFGDDVIFRNLNLRHVSFLNAIKLDKVQFINVEWNAQKAWPYTTRKTVHDESTVDTQENYPLIENIYRQLKINYESKGNYGYAGDFHYGEMEMRRLSFGTFFRRNLSLTAFYKYSSGYGENPGLAFFILLTFWVICAEFYLFFGLNVNKGNLINYDWTFNIKCFIDIQLWRDFCVALWYSIQQSFLQKSLIAEVDNMFGKIVGIIDSILGPLQIALFGLAVKRRFKR